MRCETQLTECLDIVGVGQPLLTAGQQRGLHRFRESLLRALLGDGDGFEPGVSSHQIGLSLQGLLGGFARVSITVRE